MTGRIANRRQRKKRAVRDSIVGAAAQLFVERGFDETRMDAISEAADIAVGTVYNYFKTKNDLLVAILIDDVETLVHETRTLVAHPGRDAVAALTAVGTELIVALERRPRGLWRQLFGQAMIDSLQLGQTYARVEVLLLDVVRTLLRRLRERDALPARFDIDDAAEIAFGLTNTLVYAYCRSDAMTAADFTTALHRQLTAVFAPLA